MTDSLSPRTAEERPRSNSGRRLYLVLGILLVAIGGLLWLGLSSSLNYFETVSQAVSQRAKLGTSTIRLEGRVVKGSVKRTNEGARFSLSEGGQLVKVVNTGSPPELFKAGIPVVAIGHFGPQGSMIFLSDSLMVKHSQNYIAAHPKRVKAKDGSVR